FQQNGVRLVSKPDGSGIIWNAVRAIANWAEDAIDTLQIGRICSHHEKTQAGQNCVGRKEIIDIAAQSEPTEVPGHCFRVINLNKLEVLSIRPIRGMIHDFRE